MSEPQSSCQVLGPTAGQRPQPVRSSVKARHARISRSRRNGSAVAVDRTESTRFLFSKEGMKCVCTEQF